MSTGAPDLCTHELYPLEGQPTQPVHWSPAPSLPSPPPPRSSRQLPGLSWCPSTGRLVFRGKHLAAASVINPSSVWLLCTQSYGKEVPARTSESTQGGQQHEKFGHYWARPLIVPKGWQVEGRAGERLSSLWLGWGSAN